MGQQIPIPAETLRRLSEGTMAEIDRARDEDRKTTAKGLQKKVAKAMEASAGFDGEFVSVDSDVVSSLTAFGGFGDSSFDYHDGAETMLKKYDIW